MRQNNLWNKGIRANFIRASASLVIIILVISTFYFYYNAASQDELLNQSEVLSEKAEIKNNVERSLNDTFFRARAYYVFQDEKDLELLDENLAEVKTSLAELSTVELTEEEARFLEDLQSFITGYEEEWLPQAFEFVDNDDYEALRNFANSGMNEAVNQFIERSRDLQSETMIEIEELYVESIEQANRSTLLAIAIGGVLLFTFMIIVMRVLKNIIQPIEALTIASNDLSESREITFQTYDREDEIGSLSNSFYKMATVLQEKEEELTAQNEELQSQQEELQGNQIELESIVRRMESTNNKLERYNQLNHAMSLSLSKQEFISSIFRFINEMYRFDKSAMTLVDEPVYRTMGLTEKAIQQFILSEKDELIVRLEESNHFLVKRNSTPAEQGIVEHPISVYDYYSGVLDADRKILAIFAATRIGEEFSEQEMSEIDGLMNRVSLALERTVIYEEMERSRKLNQDILDNVNEGILFISTVGDILQVNEAVCKMIGHTGAEIDHGLNKQKWIKEFTKYVEEPEALQRFFNQFTEAGFDHNGMIHHEYVVNVKEERRVIDVYGAGVFNHQERIGTLFVHRNITREHELDKMKSELVSTVSHELRTPLSSVLGFTELLLKKELKPDRQKKYLDTIYKEAKRLTSLINDFLDLQRMESGSQKYDMSACSMDKIMMEVLNNFKHVKSHRLSFVDESFDVIIKADQARIQQVLTNLVSNAIKFSPDGGDIVLSLKNEQGHLVASVKDGGLGIPEAELEKLFTKFQRIDQGDRKKIGGTGLGLAISRGIIEKHGGAIWVESIEGEGSTFYFSLPLIADKSIGHILRDPWEMVEVDMNSSTVMIIEDDSSLALLLSEELKANGFRVLHHYDPKNAYIDILKIPLKAIVVDLMLGDDMDGWELIQQLKENEETKQLPIIISSALDKSIEKMERFQVDDYLTKPYPPNELSKTLLNFVQASKNNRDGEILFPKQT